MGMRLNPHIVIIIKNDKTIWITKVMQQGKNQNNINWIEITRENIKKKTSLITRKTCYFEIKKGQQISAPCDIHYIQGYS